MTTRSPEVTSQNMMGRRGEELAVAWYEQEGLAIVDRNWRNGRHGELDIVAQMLRHDRSGTRMVTVFAEVKTRATNAFGEPSEAVGWKKQRRIRQLAAVWLMQHPYDGARDVRFDVVSIVGRKVDVIAGAF